MDQVTFTPADAQRISNAVIAHEKSLHQPPRIDDSAPDDNGLVIVHCYASLGNGNYTCKPWIYERNGASINMYVSPAATEFSILRGMNGETLRLNTRYLAKYHGTIIESGTRKALYLTAFVAPYVGQSLEVVVDVLCDPQSGIQVEKATIGTVTETLVYRSFTSLIDAPNSFAGHGGNLVRVNSSGTALEFAVPGAGSGVSYFTELVDTPNSYTGAALFAVNIDSAAKQLVFSPPLVTTQYSVSGGGNIFNTYGTKINNFDPWVSIKLVNDVETPGTNMVYGTNSKGERGWISNTNSNAVKNLIIESEDGMLDITGSPANGSSPTVTIKLSDKGVTDKEYGGIDGATGKPKVPLLSINKYGIVYEASESDLMALQKLTIKSNKGLDVTDGVVVPNAGNSFEGTVTIELKQQGTINKINTSNNYIDGASLATVESTTETIVNTLVNKVNEIVQMLKDMGASA